VQSFCLYNSCSEAVKVQLVLRLIGGLYGVAGVEGKELDTGVPEIFDLVDPVEGTVELTGEVGGIVTVATLRLCACLCARHLYFLVAASDMAASIVVGLLSWI
jgi:hypothetical protein